jgi:hypothetical protein
MLLVLIHHAKEGKMTAKFDNSCRPQELDYREADGIEVTLSWRPLDGAVLVSVVDVKHETAFQLQVEPHDALDAFHHPFAYVPGDAVGVYETSVR